MALPTLAVATPLGFRVWNPRDQVKVRVCHTSHSHMFCGYIGGGAEAALAAEAGRAARSAARSPCIRVYLGGARRGGGSLAIPILFGEVRTFGGRPDTENPVSGAPSRVCSRRKGVIGHKE